MLVILLFHNYSSNFFLIWWTAGFWVSSKVPGGTGLILLPSSC